jgi:hypothetical protein
MRNRHAEQVCVKLSFVSAPWVRRGIGAAPARITFADGPSLLRYNVCRSAGVDLMHRTAGHAMPSLMSQDFLTTDGNPPASSGAVHGQPRTWLRLEAATVFAIAVAAYASGRHSWIMFAMLFFLPDITFLAYRAGPRIGASCYNFAHSYAIPAALAALLHLLGRSIAVPLIWAAHIGFDRVLGYGLKYATAFGDTHLGLLGRRTSRPNETETTNLHE